MCRLDETLTEVMAQKGLPLMAAGEAFVRALFFGRTWLQLMAADELCQ